jgi:hypothetical protein
MLELEIPLLIDLMQPVDPATFTSPAAYLNGGSWWMQPSSTSRQVNKNLHVRITHDSFLLVDAYSNSFTWRGIDVRQQLSCSYISFACCLQLVRLALPSSLASYLDRVVPSSPLVLNICQEFPSGKGLEEVKSLKPVPGEAGIFLESWLCKTVNPRTFDIRWLVAAKTRHL